MKIEANKIAWIKNLAKREIQTPWKAYLQTIIKHPIAELPLQNFKSAKNINVNEPFYNALLQTWANINFQVPKNAKDVVTQTLWQNDLIQIGNNPVTYKSWKNAGITKIVHLLDNNGKIISKNNLQNKYQVNIKQLEYNSLINSLPPKWLDMVKKWRIII
jgi:hypothetical protein